jgi:hypothetical protein
MWSNGKSELLVRVPTQLRSPLSVDLAECWSFARLRPSQVEPCLKTRQPKRCPLMITPRQALCQQVLQHERSGSLHAIRVRANFVYTSAD